MAQWRFKSLWVDISNGNIQIGKWPRLSIPWIDGGNINWSREGIQNYIEEDDSYNKTAGIVNMEMTQQHPNNNIRCPFCLKVDQIVQLRYLMFMNRASGVNGSSTTRKGRIQRDSTLPPSYFIPVLLWSRQAAAVGEWKERPASWTDYNFTTWQLTRPGRASRQKHLFPVLR